MDFKIVREFIHLAKEEGVSELKVEDKNFKISVSFASSQPIQHVAPQVVAAVSTKVESSSQQNINNYHEIKSPFVGTFYTSASPDKPPFVKVGDKVHKGQTLCILEAMKIMNEIESDMNGEIVEICIDNESLVEYGQVLFKIKK
jgi:acetyl-CoA carboxylase biotin carboxyl carrier protein